MKRYKVTYSGIQESAQSLKAELMAKVSEVLDEGKFIQGPFVAEFEDKVAQYLNVPYAVGVNSCYDAMYAVVKNLGLGPKDEVIVPAHTFVATAAAVVHAGAKPVLADVGFDFNIRPESILEKITPNTRAIMPVHYNGWMADMDKIMDIAREYDLFVIEDAAQAFGATMNGKYAGTFGIGCFSFYPSKVLGGFGDGGMITTDSEDFATKLYQFRCHGEEPGMQGFYRWGVTGRLDALQAALLQVKLKYVDQWIARRQQIAELYFEHLANVGDLALPHYNDSRRVHIYQNYPVMTAYRDDLEVWLEERGIETQVQWREPYYRFPGLGLDVAFDEFPTTEYISRRVISLPVHPDMTDAQVEYVIDAVKAFYKRVSGYGG